MRPVPTLRVAQMAKAIAVTTQKINVLHLEKEEFLFFYPNPIIKRRQIEQDQSRYRFRDFVPRKMFRQGFNLAGRRLVVRWERQKANFDAFLFLATIHIWSDKLLVG